MKNSSTFLIGTNTKNPNLSFKISKSQVDEDIYHGMNLDESANTLINDFKSRGWFIGILENKTMPMGKTNQRVQVYAINYAEKMQDPDPDSVNGHILIFDMDSIRYTIDFQAKGEDIVDIWSGIEVDTSFEVL